MQTVTDAKKLKADSGFGFDVGLPSAAGQGNANGSVGERKKVNAVDEDATTCSFQGFTVGTAVRLWLSRWTVELWMMVLVLMQGPGV